MLGSSEFQVSPTTSLSQTLPDVAEDKAGDFVIVWQSDQSNSEPAIEARYYKSTGAAVGGLLTVNTTTGSVQATPRVAMDAAGDFVVTWASFQNPTTGYDVYARIYSHSVVASGAPFKVNQTETGWHMTPDVGMDAGGDFTIAWAVYGEARWVECRIMKTTSSPGCSTPTAPVS